MAFTLIQTIWLVLFIELILSKAIEGDTAVSLGDAVGLDREVPGDDGGRMA